MKGAEHQPVDGFEDLEEGYCLRGVVDAADRFDQEAVPTVSSWFDPLIELLEPEQSCSIQQEYYNNDTHIT